MKILYLFVVLVAASDDYYNILAMDGGGIRGIIPAVILQKMEKYAY
jgi:patatin-like phospholipase/acyl hydrolase